MSRRLRWLPRATLGALLVTAPTRVAHAAAPASPRDSQHVVAIAVALLGVRHLAEAVVLHRFSERAVSRTIAGVDLLHGSSMLALACVSKDYRRPALVSAVLAGGLATASITTG